MFWKVNSNKRIGNDNGVKKLDVIDRLGGWILSLAFLS